MALLEWVREKGGSWHESLDFFSAFDHLTGKERGVMATKPIAAGTVLLQVPGSACHTAPTLVYDDDAPSDSIAGSLSKFLYEEGKSATPVSPFVQLAMLLMWHRKEGGGSSAGAYFEALPREYTLPLMFDEEEKAALRGTSLDRLYMLNHSSKHKATILEEDDGLFRMVASRDIAEGEEVFNTYGDLSNSQLLHTYGFVETDNPYDSVAIPLPHLIAARDDVMGKPSKAAKKTLNQLVEWLGAQKGGCEVEFVATHVALLPDDLVRVAELLCQEEGELQQLLAMAQESNLQLDSLLPDLHLVGEDAYVLAVGAINKKIDSYANLGPNPASATKPKKDASNEPAAKRLKVDLESESAIMQMIRQLQQGEKAMLINMKKLALQRLLLAADNGEGNGEEGEDEDEEGEEEGQEEDGGDDEEEEEDE